MVKDSEEILGQAACTAPIPEHLTDTEILAALDRVPQDFRAVVLLVDVEEFSYKDASTILSVPIGTVMSRLSRGRKLLREQLEDLAQSYGIGKAKLEGRTA
jgi:RNA polymerase sigma-70 factor (ECF subfamily)